jgi:DNA-binding beta-propeller fold protein YncE
VHTSIKLTALGAAVLAIASAGGYLYLHSTPAPRAAAPLPGPIQHGPAPTERSWPARLETVLDDGLSDPYGIAVDRKGNVYFSDGGERNTVSVLAPDGGMRVLAGGIEGYRDGIGANASFNTPSGIALDKDGNVFVADTGNHAIRKIAADGTVSTLAGSGIAGFADGQGAQAQFNGPVGVAVGEDGMVYVADTYNDRIRRIATDGTVTTLAGSGVPGIADGIGELAQFDTPCGIAIGKDGIYIADSRNDAIRRVNPDGSVITLALTPGTEKDALLRRPMALAVTHDGFIYIAVSSRGRLLQMAPDGALAGLPDVQHPADPATGIDGNVQVYGPRSLAMAANGALLLADGPAQRLHRIVPASAPAVKVALVTTAHAAALAPAPAPTAADAPDNSLMAQRSKAPMPWPVLPQDQPHEVVGLMGEVRGSYDGDSRHHFHAGLDVQADVGSSVHVVEKAKVSDPLPNWAFGTVSEGINLGTTSYIHMKVGRDKKNKPLDGRFQLLLDDQGKPERIRVRRGTRFGVGDELGVVNQMAHVHLDLFDRGRVVNPLALPFPGLQDTVPPTIQGIALYDANDRRLPAKKGKRLEVPRELGEVNVVVDAYDQMDGNLARRRLGLYKLGYQVLQADGTPLPGYEQPRIMQTYDQLPKQREAVKVVYSADSGITVYGSKATRFTYSLLSRLEHGEVVPGRWQVSELAPGDYTLRIYAADYAGNTATTGRDLPVTID